MASHPNILAWKIAWTEDSPHGHKESDTIEHACNKKIYQDNIIKIGRTQGYFRWDHEIKTSKRRFLRRGMNDETKTVIARPGKLEPMRIIIKFKAFRWK